MSTSELVVAVKKFALEHYEEDGWDYLIECYEDGTIYDMIKEATTEKQAINIARKHCKLLNDIREDIVNS